MVQLNEDAVEAAAHEGEAMGTADLLSVIERHHPDDEPGVPWQALAEYAERLDNRRDYVFDVEGFLDELEARRTDSERWADPDAVYDLGDDRLSRYPARWHADLRGADLPEIVAYLTTEAAGFQSDVADEGRGVPERTLADVVAVLRKVEVDDALGAIEAAQSDGDLLEDADQHRNPGVYAPDQVDDDLRDDDLDA